jgi:DNA-binding XRE family transcriptional regulator
MKLDQMTKFQIVIPRCKLTVILEGPRDLDERTALSLAILRRITDFFGANHTDPNAYQSGWICHYTHSYANNYLREPKGIFLRNALKTETKEQPVGFGIRMLRLQNGWNQSELAHHAGVNRTHLSQIEKGKCKIRPETLAKIEKALGLPTLPNTPSS